jgi:hypothetical protein
MKKSLLLIAALSIYGCEKNGCATCSEVHETKHRDVVAGVTRYETTTHKYSLCEQSDVNEVNGVVHVGDRVNITPLQYFIITVTTTCE